MLSQFVKEIFSRNIFDFIDAMDTGPLSVISIKNALLQERFTEKLSRLQANLRKPQKFSTTNDLHYTVLNIISWLVHS